MARLFAVLISLSSLFQPLPMLAAPAYFARFPDVPSDSPAAVAIAELTARGIIRGYPDGNFGPNDLVLRGQSAAFVARAMGWSGEDRGNPFSDAGLVDNVLWRNVGTLAHYGVVRGYPDNTYQPTLPVLNAQVISLITRAMIARGLWQSQPDDARIYPNIPASSGHRADIATFVHYAGTLPGTATSTEAYPSWDRNDTRADFALALWTAIRGTPDQFPAISPSGEAMPVGDLPGWRQVFAEDFAADAPIGDFLQAYGSRWSAYPDGTGDTAGQAGKPSRYMPSRVLSVRNGVLDKYLHSEAGTPMAAALVPNLPGDQIYGRYAVRFRADSLAGFKTAFLLWPDSEHWPQHGEIDFPEGPLDGHISAFMHFLGASSGREQDAFDTHMSYTDWHTAVIEWAPESVTFLLDDRVIGVSTQRIPNTPMHYVMQTEACLPTCPHPDTAGHLEVDWITIYTLTR